MITTLAVLAATMTVSMAVTSSTIGLDASISANSQMGMHILSNSRRVEDGNEQDFTWISGYSLKYQGCHHVTQWNEDADEEEDVRLETKRLVRYRLCPTSSCSASSGGGCSSGYGDYIIDMNTFIEGYMENKEQVEQYQCEYTSQVVCNCENADDRETCEYNCFNNNGMDYCIDQEMDDNIQEELEVADYMMCNNFEPPNNNNRRLDQNEVEYFLGPYCAESGGSIYLGMFTDDSCTLFADSNGGRSTYLSMTGQSLPYSSESLIGPDCFSCVEPQDVNQQNNQDQQDEDEIKEFCLELYQAAGKCENKLNNNNVEPNNNACTYMKGIKITRSNGVIISGAANKNKVASAFIGIFAVSFVLLGAYVYYLKTKLDRAKINLQE
jgi:hypothetical protein